MQIIIEGTEGLADGCYGSYSHVDSDGTLHIVADPKRDPVESAYPVTKGGFV